MLVKNLVKPLIHTKLNSCIIPLLIFCYSMTPSDASSSRLSDQSPYHETAKCIIAVLEKVRENITQQGEPLEEKKRKISIHLDNINRIYAALSAVSTETRDVRIDQVRPARAQNSYILSMMKKEKWDRRVRLRLNEQRCKGQLCGRIQQVVVSEVDSETELKSYFLKLQLCDEINGNLVATFLGAFRDHIGEQVIEMSGPEGRRISFLLSYDLNALLSVKKKLPQIDLGNEIKAKLEGATLSSPNAANNNGLASISISAGVENGSYQLVYDPEIRVFTLYNLVSKWCEQLPSSELTGPLQLNFENRIFVTLAKTLKPQQPFMPIIFKVKGNKTQPRHSFDEASDDGCFQGAIPNFSTNGLGIDDLLAVLKIRPEIALESLDDALLILLSYAR